MRIPRALPVVALASVVAGCGTLNPTGDIPKNSTLIADANLRISPNYSITVEKIVFGAAGAALLFYIYDPLAPNWESREEMVAEDTYRLSMQMKRFHIGGDGEAALHFRRWAEALRQENGASSYRIVSLTEGIDSSTPIARRFAEGTVRLVREPAAQAVSVVAAPFPSSDTTVRGPGEPPPRRSVGSTTPSVPPAGDNAPASSQSDAPSGRSDATGSERRRALPRPLPPEEIDGALLRLRLDARALFAFDSAVLSSEGRSLLDREVIARRSDLGPISVLMLSGHADRIGTYEYNQRLSGARADAVRDYLVSRGFPAQAIRTEAYGERRPLATVQCDDSLARKALIDCLAPNRRVEVRADGVR